MKQLTTIVTNSRPAYVAEACTDENNQIDEIILIPIVAWCIDHDGDNSSDNACAVPVTTELGLPDPYAIYYSDTKQWTVPFSSWGTGLDELLEHFKKLHNVT